MTTQMPGKGICPRESGGRTQKRCTFLGAPDLGELGPLPSGAQVNLCDQSMFFFFFSLSVFLLEVVSQSFRASGGGWQRTDCRIRASSHMYNTDPIHRWRFVMGWLQLICDWMCSLNVTHNVQRACMYTWWCANMYKYILKKKTGKPNPRHTPLFLSFVFFSSHRNQTSACLEGLFKLASWTIYGQV